MIGFAGAYPRAMSAIPMDKGMSQANVGNQGDIPRKRGMFGGAAPQPMIPDLKPLAETQVNPLQFHSQLNSATDVEKLKRGGFDWKRALVYGLAGAAAGSGNPAGVMALQNLYANDSFRRQEELDERNRRAKLYEPRSVGGSLIQMRPDGSYQTLYDAPENFEKYAQTLGYAPGTPEYNQAIVDYRLGQWSDAATDNRARLEDDRQEHRIELEGVRQDNRYGLEDVRQGNRRELIGLRENNMRTRPAKPRGGKGSGKKSDLTGPIYMLNGKRIQYSPGAGKYVEID